MIILVAIIALVVGMAVGAIIVYKYEERTIKGMLKQCAMLAEEGHKLQLERDDYERTRTMIDTIDDLPEYLRGKYDISEKQGFTESDEDLTEIYV